MIGTNILINKKTLNQNQSNNLILNEIVFNQKCIPENGALNICFDKPYETYPYHFFKINGYTVVMEGLVYSHSISQIETVLQNHLNGPKPNGSGLLKDSATWSGEWICTIFGIDNITIFNDKFGRLDTYILDTDCNTYVGRCLHWLSKNYDLFPDKMGTALYLWCSCTIAQNTLYKDVKRVVGGSLIEINLKNGHVQYTKGQPFNFDLRQPQKMKAVADNLTQLFLQACQRMVNTWQGSDINISLSAGQDSRAVAAAFSQTGKNRVFATSFLDAHSAKDVKGATQIASILNMPYKAYPIVDKKEYEQELMQKKMGMNYIRMAFILDFNKQLLADYPKGFLYVTGDGGDRSLPYIGEPNANMSLDELTTKILHRNTSIPPTIVEKLTGVKEDEFMQYLHQLLASYPEQNNNNKSIHFNIYERAINQFMQGEDRSRFYFWTATPFYDHDFFAAAMQVPDALKKGNVLFQHFQNNLSRAVADVPDGKLGYSINSIPFKIKKLGYEWFRSSPQWVRGPLRKLGGIHIETNTATDADRNQMINDLKQFPKLQTVLNLDEVQTFLPISNREQFAYIRTLVALKNII